MPSRCGGDWIWLRVWIVGGNGWIVFARRLRASVSKWFNVNTWVRQRHKWYTSRQHFLIILAHFPHHSKTHPLFGPCPIPPGGTAMYPGLGLVPHMPTMTAGCIIGICTACSPCGVLMRPRPMTIWAWAAGGWGEGCGCGCGCCGGCTPTVCCDCTVGCWPCRAAPPTTACSARQNSLSNRSPTRVSSSVPSRETLTSRLLFHGLRRWRVWLKGRR